MKKILVFSFLFILSSIVFCQEQTIDFYGKKIKIGMTHEEVRELLRNDYILTEGNDEYWVLQDKKNNDVLHAINFRNNHVSSVYKGWADQGGDEEILNFAKRFYLLLKNLQEEGLNMAKIETNMYMQADPDDSKKFLNVYSIKIIYGEKAAEISIYDGERANNTSLTEILTNIEW